MVLIMRLLKSLMKDRAYVGTIFASAFCVIVLFLMLATPLFLIATNQTIT